MRVLTNDLRHNELITGISILSVLKHAQQLTLSKALVIEPLLSYQQVCRILCHKSMKVQSIEDLILKERIFFTSFSDRYYDNLVLTINAIQMFVHMGLIQLQADELFYCGDKFNFNADLGEMAKTRIRASEKLAYILKKGNASEIYLSLRIDI